jgi:hypothetical protein
VFDTIALVFSLSMYHAWLWAKLGSGIIGIALSVFCFAAQAVDSTVKFAAHIQVSTQRPNNFSNRNPITNIYYLSCEL